jgi:ubiquinone/menaquinone biosynthesis C-methylase UbiE
MNLVESDRAFGDAISDHYERLLVPLIFEPYAAALAERLALRLAGRPRARVLEVAAGTGALTRAMSSRLPAGAEIVATDLNEAMLDRARSVGTSRRVEWRRADALALPFPDASFDVVVCQFGTMFFPDKPHAFSEARRVLGESGVLLFSVWDRIEDNEFADVVTEALAKRFPDDPPRFLARTPHGYHDRAAIERDLARGGFPSTASFETLAERSRASSPDVPAIAYCEGTPLRNEIEARAPGRLAACTAIATEALRRRFGGGPVDGRIQAHLIAAERR